MDVVVLEEVLGDAEGAGVAPDVAKRRLRGFAHHVAERTGDDQFLVALHLGGFDEDDVAAGLGPDQAGGDADPVLLLDHLEMVLSSARGSARPVRAVIVTIAASPVGLKRFLGDLAADRGDLPLQVPDAGLARVFLDDLLHRLVGESRPVR